ncbi:Ribonuclease H-like domain [Cinara cedri]|uniref:Ribonuclease H-like domain n=1 Tax=Cinara cedri TaxID=506608 RepID=A0A5E4MRT3_9HEMI|nr:Ribonuclease H-like domain [Cinara cedri]
MRPKLCQIYLQDSWWKKQGNYKDKRFMKKQSTVVLLQQKVIRYLIIKKAGKCNHCKKLGDAFIDCSKVMRPNDENSKWYVDSGAINHIEWFVYYKQFYDTMEVHIGGRTKITAYEIKENVFSSSACLDKVIKMISDNKMCKIIKTGKTLAVGSRDNKLFTLEFKTISIKQVCQANLVKKVDILEHIYKNIRHICNYHLLIQKRILFREACIYGKQYRELFPTSKTTAEPGEIIHSDVCGPMKTNFLGSKKYFVLFKDDFSNIRYVYFLTHKSEISDNRLEYINADIKAILNKLRIQHQISTPYTQQNGSAKHDIQIIIETARTLIASKNLSKNVWTKVVNMVYVLNHTGNSDHEKGISIPSEINGEKFTKEKEGKTNSGSVIENEDKNLNKDAQIPVDIEQIV